jgi:bacterioferritin
MTTQSRVSGSDHELKREFDEVPAAMVLDRQSLIDGLNHDLADKYLAMLMYIHYAAKITGPYCRELRALFQAGMGDIQRHAQFLADKVVALGGEPTTNYYVVPVADRARTMLERALELEERAIAGCNSRILQAKGSRDTGLKVALENQIVEGPVASFQSDVGDFRCW